jgi:hypothetical protein
MRGAISSLPNTPLWRDAQLKDRNKFTLLLPSAIVLVVRWRNTPYWTLLTISSYSVQKQYGGCAKSIFTFLFLRS